MGGCGVVLKKKRVLLTGGSGFIGRNIIEHLQQVSYLYAPLRSELNLLDEMAVRYFLEKNHIEIVIHAANPNPVKNSLDKQDSMFEDSIRAFINLYHAQEVYERMYTFGSGAEYDKSRDIIMIREEDIGRSIPYDSYGLSKYLMNQLIDQSDKQCNLRIFGCFGPTDHESKFITHAIQCCKKNLPITIRQDCYFDYMYVSDLGRVLEYFIYNVPKYKAYNVCTGKRHSLKEIAKCVRDQMKTDNDIILLKPGMNREYTGCNERLINELGDFEFTPLENGIHYQIENEHISVE